MDDRREQLNETARLKAETERVRVAAFNEGYDEAKSEYLEEIKYLREVNAKLVAAIENGGKTDD